MRLEVKGKSRGVKGDMLSTAATHGLVLFHFSAYPSLLLGFGSTIDHFFVLLCYSLMCSDKYTYLFRVYV